MLNRPVVTQLRKIGFSAFIYGVLVLVCLGGVVWGLFSTTKGVLPIHWSSNEPVFEFPVDLLFYNFLMPLAVKFFKPSDGLQTMYDWWFKRSARVLRLTSFMFGERQKDEEGYICYPNWLSFLLRQRPDFENPVLEGQEAPVGQLYFQRDGRFVRAPASDSVRKHKGSNIFIPVDEFNRRLDVDPSQDPPNGPTGSNSPDWRLAYIPPYFRVRLALVAVGVWFFAALTGVSITIGPLILGRHLLRHLVPETVRLNDIYAFSIGIYVLGGAALVLAKAPAAFGFLKALTGPLTAAASKSSYIEKFKKVGISTHELVLRMAKIGYIITAFAIVIPTLVAMIIEFYFIIPLHTAFNASLAAEAAGNVLASNTTAIAETAARVDIAAAAAETPAHMAHTIHFVQDWTLGVLYVKMMGKMLLLDETSVWARSLRGIIAHGWLNPDAKLATRVFIAPCVGGMVAALLIPLVGARCAIAWGVTEDAKVYRYAFPVVMAGALVGALLYAAWRVVEGWKEGVRDEVYLRGMRIHNHGEEAGVEKLPRRRARAASAAL